jgi:hypothetical protein
MPLPAVIIEESKVNTAIDIVIRELSPDVKRIRCDRGQDWSGDDSFFFRILVSDDAAKSRLRETTVKALRTMESYLNLETLGFRVYHNVRSVSEQESLREKSWE